MTQLSATPLFINSSHGRIFTLFFPATSAGKNSVLLIPPFADEMNKSRRMYSELARRLSQRNLNVLLFDLYGTGDSEGLLPDANWQFWLENIKACLDFLNKKNDGDISLMAMRTGALLATDYLKEADPRVSKLLLWQPVLEGKVFFNQFMRLRLAASMMSDDKNKETSKDLKALLDSGELLEIAGYAISSVLASSFESASLKSMPLSNKVDIAWFDIVSDEKKEAPLINRKQVETWQQAGLNVRHQKMTGMAFWSSTEIIEVPELIDESEQFLIEALGI